MPSGDMRIVRWTSGCRACGARALLRPSRRSRLAAAAGEISHRCPSAARASDSLRVKCEVHGRRAYRRHPRLGTPARSSGVQPVRVARASSRAAARLGCWRAS